MVVLFTTLFLLSLLALVIGLIRPSLVIRWGQKKTRGRVFLTYGLAAVVFFTLLGITVPPTPEKPKAGFAEQPVTEASVRDVLKGLKGISVDLKNITKVEVLDDFDTPEPEDKIVHVYYLPQALWDEKDAMRVAVHTSIKAMEALFKNPKVKRVTMWQQGKFTDKYGKESIETAIRITMDRETADKIVDWKKVDEQAWSDYKTFFDLAELQFVHPAVFKGLSEK